MKRECADLGSVITVTSAGLHAVLGRAAHPLAVVAAREFGISLDDHRARLLTPEMVEQASVIFTMDYQNQVELVSLYPGAKHKTFLLSAYAGKSHNSAEIVDPYNLGEAATRHCYQTLVTCIENLAHSISVAKPDHC